MSLSTEKYSRMLKVGVPKDVTLQSIIVDLQCPKEDPKMKNIITWIDRVSSGGSIDPIPREFTELSQTKYERMSQKGIRDDKIKYIRGIDEFYSHKRTQNGDPVVYDIPTENKGLGDLLNDRVVNDKTKEETVVSQSQQRAKEIKKEAIAIREAFSKAAVEQVTDDQDPVPIAIPKREADNYNITKKEFHSYVDFYYPEPEIIREDVINLVGVANVSRPCTIREHLPARMYSFLNVLTPAECSQLMSNLDFSTPEETIQQQLITTAVNSNQTLIRTSIRRNFIDEEIARVVWNAISSTLPAELPDGRKLSGIRSKMNYYRYGEGQYFKTHIDGGFTFSETGDTSEYTFVIYLNDDFTGGTTRYCYLPEWNNELREVKPIQGGMLVFRQSDMKHCGVTLAKGFKHIIQGMVMYGPLKYNQFGKPIGKNPQLFHTTQCVWIAPIN